MPDCRDESDENNCQLISMQANYNKNLQPIGQNQDGSIIPVQVTVSLDLMRVVEIKEIFHSIRLQFRLTLQWRENNRVLYQNLKRETTLNVLTENDKQRLWLPRIVYENTDQKESIYILTTNHQENVCTKIV